MNRIPALREGWKRLYLCRHGETDYNAKKIVQGGGVNTDLNSKGLEQARRLGRAATDLPISALATSPLNRAVQTMGSVETAFQSVGDKSLGEPTIVPELSEMGFGEFEGKVLSEVWPQFTKLYDMWADGTGLDQGTPGGETPNEVAARAMVALDKLASLPGDHILAVTHGRYLKILLASATGMGLKRMHEIHHTNCGINVLDVELASKTYTLQLMNDISHLEGMDVEQQ